MEKHEQKSAMVVPVILRPCDWKDFPFGKLQGLPQNVTPITKWKNEDEAFLDVVEGIKKLLTPLTVKTEDTSSKFIHFQQDTVLVKLPRGYVVIHDIEFNEDSGWAVTAHHYHYDYDLYGGTHFHESYQRTWETLDGKYYQCLKLGIPKGDWNYALDFLSLMVEIRTRDKATNLEDLIELESTDDHLTYHKKGTKILTPTTPQSFKKDNKTGDLRDIIAELELSPWKNYELETLHKEFESLRRTAHLTSYDLLQPDHPALQYVKEIAEDYKRSFDLDNLKKWTERLSDALYDVIKYVR